MVFGKIKTDIYQLTESTADEINKAYKRFEEKAERYGLKVLLWGSPLGMHDESVVVFDVGESIDNYFKFLEENIAIIPYTNMKTHPIIVM